MHERRGRPNEPCRTKRRENTPLATYWTEAEAQEGAARAQRRFGTAFQTRHCGDCGWYHIQRTPKHCPLCCGRDGKPKQAYESKEAAEEVAAGCTRKLRVYPCPYGHGYHLTKGDE